MRYSSKWADPEIRASMRMSKQVFRERTKYWKLIMYRFMDFMRAGRYCETYVWNNMKIFRTVMHFIQQQKGWPDAGLVVFKMPRLVQPEPLTLTSNHLRQLIAVKFGQSFIEQRLAIVRDLVITGCITGLRYSDLMGLRWENLDERDGKTWLRMQSQKTGIQTKLLLPDFLINLIRRYRELRRKFIFPRISNVNLNIQIKKLGKRMGWDVPTQVIRSHGGALKIERVGKFYELLTTHTMRRTCITLMLQMGMPEHLARQVSGHAPNSREFFRYVKIAQDWQDKETARIYNQLLGGS